MSIHNDTLGIVPLESLRHDMYLEIISKLDICAIGRVKQLNKYWHALVNPALYTTPRDMRRRVRICSLRGYNPLWAPGNKHLLLSRKLWINHITVTFDIIKDYFIDPENLVKNFGLQLSHITANPNITIEMVEELGKLTDLSSTSFVLSRESTITLTDLLAVKLQCNLSSSIPSLTMHDYEYFIKNITVWNAHDAFSRGANITIQDVKNNPQLNWDIKLLWNDNITAPQLVEHFKFETDDYIQLASLGAQMPNNRTKVTDIKNILVGAIVKYPELFDNVSVIGFLSEHIDINVLKLYPQKGWNWAKLSETIPLTDMILNPDFPWKWNHAIRIVRGAVFLEIDSDHQYVKLQLAADAGTLSEADICGDAGIAWNQYQITRLKYLDDATVIRIIQKYKFKFDCFSDCRNFNPQFVLQNPSVGWDVMTLINAHIHNYPEIFITGILKNTYMYA